MGDYRVVIQSHRPNEAELIWSVMADSFAKSFLIKTRVLVWFKSFKVLSQLTISHNWFRLWFGAAGITSNKIWWLCLVPTSTARFANEVGYRMAKIWQCYTRKIFLWTMTSENEEHDNPSHILKSIFGLHASVIFLDPKMCSLQYICRVLWSQILVVNCQN